jgi:hypothetical protein
VQAETVFYAEEEEAEGNGGMVVHAEQTKGKGKGKGKSKTNGNSNNNINNNNNNNNTSSKEKKGANKASTAVAATEMAPPTSQPFSPSGRSLRSNTGHNTFNGVGVGDGVGDGGEMMHALDDLEMAGDNQLIMDFGHGDLSFM